MNEERTLKGKSLPSANDAIKDRDMIRLYEQVRLLVDDTRRRVVRSVNAEMVRSYWLIGQAIVEHEQKGKDRAGYGRRLIESLAERLTHEFGSGFEASNLWHMRKFYETFPRFLDAPRRELSWTHYRFLLKVDSPDARAFYEHEATAQNWSTRELERQIVALLYERTLVSLDTQQILRDTRIKAEKYKSQEFAQDPDVLKFLGVQESHGGE